MAKSLVIVDRAIPIDDIDAMLFDDLDGKAEVRFHQRDGKTLSCSFETKEDRAESWEVIRGVLAGEDFIDCDDMFLRSGSIVQISEVPGEQECSYLQLLFRSGVIIRIPYFDVAHLRTDAAKLRTFVGSDSIVIH